MRFRFLALLMRAWLFAFSDLGDPGGGGGGAPTDPAPPAGAPPAPTPEGAPPAGDPPPPDPDSGFESFGTTYEDLLAQEGDTINGVPRTVLERHAREHQSYRERYQPIARAFNVLHPDDQQGFVAFLEAMTSEDAGLRAQAADWMRAVLDNVSPAQAAAIQAGADAAAGLPAGQQPPAPAGDFDPFDPDAIEKLVTARLEAALAERDDKASQEAMVEQAQRQMQDHAKGLAESTGIAGFGDPTSTEFGLLLLEAQRLSPTIEDPIVRLDKAAELIQERFSSAAQQLLKAKGSDGAPSPAAPDGGAPAGVKKPSTLDEAADAAATRIDAILRGEPGN